MIIMYMIVSMFICVIITISICFEICSWRVHQTLDAASAVLIKKTVREEQWETCRGGQTTLKAKIYLGDFWTSRPEQVLKFPLWNIIEKWARKPKCLWEDLGTPAPTWLRAPRPAKSCLSRPATPIQVGRTISISIIVWLYSCITVLLVVCYHYY